MPSGLAAGHPATVDAGIEVLEDGGGAADAAVAACLVSCVAETVMTGLLGGGHAVYWDAGRRESINLDCFVAVPGLGLERPAAPLTELEVPFGEELLHYAVGIASCAVPGVPAGLAELSRRFGRLPWPRLCEPALRLARDGVAMPRAHAECLAMLAPVMTMARGGELYSPDGALLAPGETLHQPGLVHALEALSQEGAESLYKGSLADALLELMADEGSVTRRDLAAYRAQWRAPVAIPFRGYGVSTRAGISGLPSALAVLSPTDGTELERVAALLQALAPAGPGRTNHTTNLCAVDADGNACVLTTSLGLGSGDWLPGYDLQLNSMLGELDLLVGELEPGARMQSMMAPLVAADDDGLALAAGAAGGTRLRSALVQVVAAIVDEGLAPQAAVDRPRVHPAGTTVHAEPELADTTVAALERGGWTVQTWPSPHHFFGGVSVIGRAGAAGDPRRGGDARLL